MKLETQLLIFPGFYGTILGEYLEDQIDVIEYEVINWKATFENIAKEFFDLFIEDLDVKERLKECGIALEYKELWSPRFYNFQNDKLYMTASYEPEKLSRKVFDNEYYTEIVEILRYEFTSRPGFTSFYSNEIGDIFKYLHSMDDEIILAYVLDWLIQDIDLSYIEETILERYFEFLEYETENEKV